MILVNVYVSVNRETQYKNLTTMLSEALDVSQTPVIRMFLDEVDWSSDLASSLQQSTLNSNQLQLCIKDFTAVSLMQLSPQADVSNLAELFTDTTASASATPQSKLQVCPYE